MIAASRFMTSRDAPTYGARSVCNGVSLIRKRQNSETNLVDNQQIGLKENVSQNSLIIDNSGLT